MNFLPYPWRYPIILILLHTTILFSHRVLYQLPTNQSSLDRFRAAFTTHELEVLEKSYRDLEDPRKVNHVRLFHDLHPKHYGKQAFESPEAEQVWQLAEELRQKIRRRCDYLTPGWCTVHITAPSTTPIGLSYPYYAHHEHTIITPLLRHYRPLTHYHMIYCLLPQPSSIINHRRITTSLQTLRPQSESHWEADWQGAHPRPRVSR